MKFHKIEQIYKKYWWSRHGKYEKFMKKYTSRILRRAAKLDPEEAPKKHRYKGYTD